MLTREETIKGLRVCKGVKGCVGCPVRNKPNCNRLLDKAAYKYLKEGTIIEHAEWIPIINYRSGEPDGRYYCSKCRRVETAKANYCRVCGAKMDGGNSNVT